MFSHPFGSRVRILHLDGFRDTPVLLEETMVVMLAGIEAVAVIGEGSLEHVAEDHEKVHVDGATARFSDRHVETQVILGFEAGWAMGVAHGGQGGLDLLQLSGRRQQRGASRCPDFYVRTDFGQIVQIAGIGTHQLDQSGIDLFRIGDHAGPTALNCIYDSLGLQLL